MRQDAALSSTEDFVERSPTQPPERRELERAIGRQLVERIGEPRFEMWFEHERSFQLPLEATATVLVVSDNEFACQRVQTSFGQDIRQIVDRVCGPQFTVRFEVAVEQTEDSVTGRDCQPTLFSVGRTDCASSSKLTSSPTKTNSDNQRNSIATKAADERASSVPAKASGDHAASDVISVPIKNPQRSRRDQKPKHRGVRSFFFGGENQLIEKAVEKSFQQPGTYSPLFFYGSPGCGKTHLLESFVSDFRRQLKKPRCVYLSAEQFTGLFLHSLRGGSGLPVFRRKYRDLDLLAIDDLQFFDGKKATLSEFQYTVDHLIRCGKQVVVAADRPPIELNEFGSELTTRLSAGLVFGLDFPDFDGRMKIADRFCRQLNVTLPADVLELLCNSLTRDVRKLSGAVNRLSVLASISPQPISVQQARDTLGDLFSVSGAGNTSMPTIEKVICEIFDVKPSELKSSSRRKRISSARMLAMYLSRQHTSSAFSEIGDYYGGRTHSTVIAAERKVAKWLDENDGIALSHAKYPVRDVLKRIESNLRIG